MGRRRPIGNFQTTAGHVNFCQRPSRPNWTLIYSGAQKINIECHSTVCVKGQYMAGRIDKTTPFVVVKHRSDCQNVRTYDTREMSAKFPSCIVLHIIGYMHATLKGYDLEIREVTFPGTAKTRLKALKSRLIKLCIDVNCRAYKLMDWIRNVNFFITPHSSTAHTQMRSIKMQELISTLDSRTLRPIPGIQKCHWCTKRNDCNKRADSDQDWSYSVSVFGPVHFYVGFWKKHH